MSDVLVIKQLNEQQIDEIVASFKAIGWHKPKSIYEAYLSEQTKGVRSVFVATIDNKFCGYVTIKCKSDYSGFNKANIPELADLNVLPEYRNQGIGTKLIKQCERIAAEKGHQTFGLGVGLTSDYGNAQRLYIKLGYVPDGNGIHSHQRSLCYDDKTTVDDELVLYFKKSLLNSDDLELNLPNWIETPRLLLRPPRIDDANILNSAIIESFDVLNKYMLWAKEKPSLEESLEVVRRESAAWLLNKKYDAELMLVIFDKNSNDFIAATGFHHIDWGVPCAETGYWIRKKYAGQGYMTEAINAVTRYAFEVLKVKRLAITCDIDNERSKKIPERLGYKFESLMKSNNVKPLTQEVSDTLVYVRNDLINLPELKVTWK